MPHVGRRADVQSMQTRARQAFVSKVQFVLFIFEGKKLVEEESLSAIFLTLKVKGETKHKKSQNTLKISGAVKGLFQPRTAKL